VARAVLTNFSRPDSAHRQWIFIRVHFRHPPAQVRELVVGAIRSVPGIRTDPAPDCLLWEFKDDAVSYACRYWIDDFQVDDRSDSEVRSILWYAMHRAGMEVPFPSLNVNMTEMNRTASRASSTRTTRAGSTRCPRSTCSARWTPRRSTAWRAGCAWRSSGRAR